MITDEQICIACAAYNSSDVVHSQLSAMRKALEAYEQSKPKPEPVGFIYPSEYEKALQEESCCLMFVVPATNLSTGEEASIPLYTTPPTREPLSEDFLLRLAEECTTQFFNGVHQNATIHFARAVEQAHGIGVTND